ncbi:MAG: hypothetical protein ACXVYM_04235 [Gaiellaceae bacterium]
MSTPSLASMAARNNAEWCDAFCRTHGVVGRFRPDFWFSAARAPVYYPDAVTLLPDAAAAAVVSSIDTSEGCSVKDSFACLDLGSRGFRPLFRAEWLLRKPTEYLEPPLAWSAVTSAADLAEWETAWAQPDASSGFFRPALLEDEAVAVLAGRDGERIVAGATANCSASAIGLGNVFDLTGDLPSAFGAAAGAAAAIWGEMPTVGYEHGEPLDAALEAGFESIGDLIVWIKAPEPRR